MKKLDQSNWNRKEHFDFFKQFKEPFFGLVTEIDCTQAYKISKENKYSFFSYYLHKSIQAVNLIEEFKYRIIDDEIIIHETIDASPTIGRTDGTFGFSYVPFSDAFNVFDASLKKEIDRVQSSNGLGMNENESKKNVVYYSSIPWNTFSSLTHATNFIPGDSIPRITFGKMFQRDDKSLMNIAIYVHHGLADGFHISKYLALYQKLMNGES
ncbi:MAG: chloramphenicol O-acetyltransferase type A [Flavobacteriaceae bacterium]|jgi:chloramphenicol O-acetyltransferase type A|uniref:CatA-like O-acetyltransferase n=1 Tax=Candidatus Marifrigoribacter sp. Uisw_064 TaxID=3230970 RepID=UPI003AEDDA7A